METALELPVLKTNLQTVKGNLHTSDKESVEDLEVRVYDSEEAFEDLRSEWNALVLLADSTLCMSLEWIENWWNHFGLNPNRYLYIIAVRSEGKLVALAPFYIGMSKIGTRIIHKRLQLIGSGGSTNEQLGYTIDYGISDFLDICVHPDYKNPAGNLFINIISELRDNFDAITFHQIREDSFIKQVLYPRIEGQDWSHDLIHTDTCPFIDLKGYVSLEEYVKGVKSNARRRLRQTLRAMDQNHNFDLIDVNTPDKLEEATNRLINMHQNRWNELGFPGVFNDERFTAFFKDIINVTSKNGWLWFNEARDDEGVSASRMLIEFNGRYYDYISGLDTASKSTKYRPGFGLLLAVVNDALSRKVNRIELLRGEEGYKYDFTNQSFKNWKLIIASQRKYHPIEKVFNKVLGITSRLYAIISKEFLLMKVQYVSNGILRTLPGYIGFRVESLKKKM